MRFLHPEILWLLTATLIPIIIHLVNFRRRRTVYFSNTAVLKEIYHEKARVKRLRDLIILLLRIFFIVFLVIAFAQPYNDDATVNVDTQSDLVILYVDNSMSMQREGETVTLVDEARNNAHSIVEKLSATHRYILLTNSREVENEYPMNSDEVLLRLDAMRREGQPMSLSEIYESAEMIKNSNGYRTATLFLLSDFQNNVFDEIVKRDSTIVAVPLRLSSDLTANIWIDTVFTSAPLMLTGEPSELTARIHNGGAIDKKAFPVELSIDGASVALTTVDVAAGQSAEVTMSYLVKDEGHHQGEVLIRDLPITFDDSYTFSFEVTKKMNVVEVMNRDGEGDLLWLFESDEMVDYQAFQQNKYTFQDLEEVDMLVVDGDVKLGEAEERLIYDYATRGGGVVVCASSLRNDDFLCEMLKINILNEKSVDTLSVNSILKNNDFFKDVIVDIPKNANLPKVYGKYSIRRNLGSKMSGIVGLQDGTPWLLESSEGNGKIYLFTSSFDLSSCDFLNNALCVPIFYKMALSAKTTTFIINENANRNESLMTFFDEKEIKAFFQENELPMLSTEHLSLGESLTEMHLDNSLWKTFVVLALVAFLMELGLIFYDKRVLRRK